MDIAFQLHQPHLHSFLQDVMKSFGCSYICLWSYFPQPFNCLRFLDGFLKEIEEQPCSSSSAAAGSLAQLLFEEYKQLEFSVDDGLVPGLAHKHNDPCLKLENSQLQTYASSDVQRQFYLASSINYFKRFHFIIVSLQIQSMLYFMSFCIFILFLFGFVCSGSWDSDFNLLGEHQW